MTRDQRLTETLLANKLGSIAPFYGIIPNEDGSRLSWKIGTFVFVSERVFAKEKKTGGKSGTCV